MKKSPILPILYALDKSLCHTRKQNPNVENSERYFHEGYIYNVYIFYLNGMILP